MEIKENDQKCLNDEWGINDKSKLRNISKDGFKVMEGNDAQNSRRILTRQLQKMLAWMLYYKSEMMIFEIPLRNGRATSMRII